MAADMSEIRQRAKQHEEEIASVQWFTPSELAARWHVALSTVHAIPIAQLEYKEFGQGEKLKRRRYRAEWVEAYEAITPRSVA
jgi:hypothetical protein